MNGMGTLVGSGNDSVTLGTLGRAESILARNLFDGRAMLRKSSNAHERSRTLSRSQSNGEL